MNKVNIRHIAKEINSSHSDCSTGEVNIPMQIIEPVAFYIAQPLINMLNSFIEKEKFTTKLKTVRISVIPKVRPLTDF